MKSIKLKIEGMHCNGCAETIHLVLSTQPGVHSSEVSFVDGRARLLVDPQSTNEVQLVEVIQKLGFGVVAIASTGVDGSVGDAT